MPSQDEESSSAPDESLEYQRLLRENIELREQLNAARKPVWQRPVIIISFLSALAAIGGLLLNYIRHTDDAGKERGFFRETIYEDHNRIQQLSQEIIELRQEAPPRECNLKFDSSPDNNTGRKTFLQLQRFFCEVLTAESLLLKMIFF